MATTNHYSSPFVTFTEAAAAATVTSTLPTPVGGMSWVIDSISFQTVTAFSVWSVDVQESGGTSCWKIGATSANHPGVLVGPIATKTNDAPKVVLTTTGATSVVLNVTARLVAGGL